MIATRPAACAAREIDFPKVTVSGTHVALMAATLANGTTVIDATPPASLKSPTSPIA